MNLYNYVFSNPIFYIDPWGLDTLVIPLPGAGAGAGAGAAGAGATLAGMGIVVGGIVLGMPSETAGPDDDMRPLPPASPPASSMAAPGNQVDTRIQQDYGEYVSNEKLNCREPDDRCKWLNKNKHRYTQAQYKKTAKAWGCRRSRVR